MLIQKNVSTLVMEQTETVLYGEKKKVKCQFNKPIELFSFSLIQLCDDIGKGAFNPGNDN